MNEKFTPGNWRGDPVTGNIYPEGVEYAIAGAYSSPVSPEEYEANLRLLAHAKDLYHVAVMARVFIPKGDQIRKDVEKVLREINPDFDKYPEVTDIKKFAECVKRMRHWQRAKEHDLKVEGYVANDEQLVDSIVAEILQEVQL